ncbi:hypothetical protein F3J34_23395 [Klebsiella sp. Ap-873]|uniref:Lipoprotein n=1 Tax=Cedecea neteri TaxID=158822 RepID=A0AAN0VV74_9ENTR|nr:putative T6SS immunity periplasmic lipoprotein [Cedecea neteri]AIR62922.1 hypothetical protein LH23_20390 [Cedecea neteri]NIG76520.1 hypothetical protein [Klebsiella sp. Ap-873]
MKYFAAFIPVCILLVGCVGENIGVGEWRSYDIINGNLCFTVDKSDVLSRYSISSIQDGYDKDLATVEFKHLIYPDTCIKVPLTRGYIYQTSYTLNNKVYRYGFFIDNNGLFIELGGGK